MNEILEFTSKTDELIGILYKSRMIAKYYNDIEMLGRIENELTGYSKKSILPKNRGMISYLNYMKMKKK